MSMKSSLNVWSDFDKPCFDYLGKGRLTEWTQGPSIKDVRTLGGEGGQEKVDQREQGGGSGSPIVDVRLEKKL